MTRDEITQQIIAARLAKGCSASTSRPCPCAPRFPCAVASPQRCRPTRPFSDGIMSARNFSVNLEKKPHPAGDRVVVTFDGKFLPYDWTAADTAR